MVLDINVDLLDLSEYDFFVSVPKLSGTVGTET